MMQWQTFVPAQEAINLLGLIPGFLFEEDERPARDQINERYAHGGGWRPMEGWHHSNEGGGLESDFLLLIQYPGDPVYEPIAMTKLHNETIWVYPYAWVAIESAKGEVEITRLD